MTLELKLDFDLKIIEDALVLIKKEDDIKDIRDHAAIILDKSTWIQDYCTKKFIKNFYDSMRVDLRTIYASIDQIFLIFKRNDNPGTGMTVKRKLLSFYTPFSEALEEAAEMSPEERKILEEKTTSLWQGQAKDHSKTLESIKSRMITEEILDKKRIITVYFSYAWPTHKNSAMESWVQPFLQRLYEVLSEASLRVYMDTKDCGPGENIIRFMEKCDDSQVVLLFGTRSLVEKHKEERSNNVQIELAKIKNRLGNKNGVIPVLLSGTGRSSFPELLSKLPVFDGREFDDYYDFVSNLIRKIVNALDN